MHLFDCALSPTTRPSAPSRHDRCVAWAPNNRGRPHKACHRQQTRLAHSRPVVHNTCLNIVCHDEVSVWLEFHCREAEEGCLLIVAWNTPSENNPSQECPSSSVLECVRKNRTASLRTGNGVGELGKSPMHSDNNATQRALGWLEFVLLKASFEMKMKALHCSCIPV